MSGLPVAASLVSMAGFAAGPVNSKLSELNLIMNGVVVAESIKVIKEYC